MQNEKSAVIEMAREIALATVNLARTDDRRTASRLQNQIDRSIERLKQLDRAPDELRQAVRGNPGSVTKMASAYALYLLDPAEVETAVEVLVTEMNQPPSAVMAQTLLAAIGAPAVPTLIGHLNNSNVVHLLGTMGPHAEEAVPALLDVLGTKNVEVAAALSRIGTDPAIEAALPILMEAARDPYNHYSTMAVIALGELGGENGREAVPAVREALNSANSDTRIQAAIALADLDDTEYAVNALASIVEDNSLDGRYLALNKLRSMGSQALPAKPSLIGALLNEQDTRFGDRALAASALRSIDPDDPEVSSALERAAREPQLRRQMNLP